MRVQPLLEESSFVGHSATAEPALRVAIAYEDLGAGQRAMRLLADVARNLGNEIEFQPLPWSFKLLADVDWRAVAATDAVNADILIIASTRPNPLPPAVGQWTETSIRRKQGSPAAVVALFGPDANPDGAGSSRLEAVQRAAQQAGLDFFAPAPRLQQDETLASIHRRAEMVTPLLSEILHHPARRDNQRS